MPLLQTSCPPSVAGRASTTTLSSRRFATTKNYELVMWASALHGVWPVGQGHAVLCRAQHSSPTRQISSSALAQMTECLLVSSILTLRTEIKYQPSSTWNETTPEKVPPRRYGLLVQHILFEANHVWRQIACSPNVMDHSLKNIEVHVWYCLPRIRNFLKVSELTPQFAHMARN